MIKSQYGEVILFVMALAFGIVIGQMPITDQDSSGSDYFWFSQEQHDNAILIEGHVSNFAELNSGKIVEYTEGSSRNKISGEFDDYVFLGQGRWHHTEVD
jgi:hypothetical protein